MRCRPLLFAALLLAARAAGAQAPAARAPAAAPDPTSVRVTQIAEGGLATRCAVTTEGQAWCWGDNGEGELGVGDTRGHVTPAPVRQAPGVRFTTIAMGRRGHTCALTAAGQAWCWGYGSAGQLGNGLRTSSPRPVMVPQRGARYASLAPGELYTCALADDGTVHCWGDLARGEGVTGDYSRPWRMAQGALRFTALTSGGSHLCALDAGGRAYCWGDDGWQTLGEGPDSTKRIAPTPVAQGDVRYKAIAASSYHTCALATDGRAWCWGDNGHQEIGDDTRATDRPVPTAVAQGDVILESIAVDDYRSCGLDAAGRAWCWGYSEHAAFGGQERASRPVLLDHGAVRYASLGRRAHCGVTAEGRGYCWGAFGYGGFGDATSRWSPNPEQIIGPREAP